jgi:hypothetical protein
MAALPTVTVRIRDVLRLGQERAVQLGRTQQLELGDDLFIRIAPGGRSFLLFQLEGEPDHNTARAVAEALGLLDPVYGWHQGQTLRSLTVTELGAAQADAQARGDGAPDSE